MTEGPSEGSTLPRDDSLANTGAFVAAVIVIAGVAVVDALTGPDLAFALFYLVPIILVAWRHKPITGVATALTAATAWTLAMLPSDAFLHWGLLAWNASTRLVIFVGLSLVISRVRSDRRRLATLNEQLRIAIRHESDAARTDEKTGLLNFRGFSEFAERELARCRRLGHPLSLAYLDLDNFKQVNDLLGHTTGDRVLGEIAASLRDNVRQTDVITRFGGDEFVILMPDTDIKAAVEAMERLCQATKSITKAYSACRLGLSIGVTSFPQLPPDVTALLRAADAAMYEAKRAGKGQIAVSVLSEGDSRAKIVRALTDANDGSPN